MRCKDTKSMKYYKCNEDKQNFHSAKLQCENLKGTLATNLKSDDFKILQDCCPYCNGVKRYWIGLEKHPDCSDPNPYRWIDENKCTAMPDIPLSKAQSENIKTAVVLLFNNHEGYFEEKTANSQSDGYVCQFSSTTTTTSEAIQTTSINLKEEITTEHQSTIDSSTTNRNTLSSKIVTSTYSVTTHSRFDNYNRSSTTDSASGEGNEYISPFTIETTTLTEGTAKSEFSTQTITWSEISTISTVAEEERKTTPNTHQSTARATSGPTSQMASSLSSHSSSFKQSTTKTFPTEPQVTFKTSANFIPPSSKLVLSPIAIAGLTIGIVCFIIVLILLLCWCYKRNNKKTLKQFYQLNEIYISSSEEAVEERVYDEYEL